VRRLAPFAIAVSLAAGCGGGGGTLSHDSLRKEAESIQSVAAEGALLAHDSADGRTTTPFVSVHSEVLAESAGKVAQKLESAAVEPGLEQDRARAERLATRIEEELDQLDEHPDDQAEARRVADELDQAAKAAEELAR
jgi:small-conductance mechanosensitive channel